jgi:hypothetical protein
MKIKVTRICFCLILFLTSRCGKNPDMVQADLKRLKPFAALDNGIPVSILEKFESAPCKGDELSANVYKVKLLSQGDTIFVFEICKEIWSNEDKGLFVVVKSPYTTREFLIPDNSNIPDSSKYLLGTMKRAKF